jgi:eukaryotic-like serine/threonine-protein kinase
VPFEDQTGTVVQKICMACSREFKGSIGTCPHDGNALVALPADQWLDKRLAGKYVIKQKLGTGGMGEVYLAWHELMQTWVAIKFLKSSFVEDSKAVQRFQQEAMAAKRLKHTNVITLYDFDLAPTGQPYMVMEYLVGHDKDNPAISMAQLIKQKHANGGNLPIESIIHIIAQASDALDHAHRQGVIHRDIKPANIMIVPSDQDPLFVKVVDFGVAKLLPINNLQEESQALTTFGEVCGSPVYMSPEQCAGQALDSRADIYSMGVVLYEAITGKLPLLGRNMVETMQKHMEEKPKPFNQVRPDLFVPEKLEQVVMRALQKAPHLRHQSMAELAQDLRFSIPRAGQAPAAKSFVGDLPQETKPSTTSWLWPAAGGALFAIIAVAVFFLASQKPQAPVVVAPPPAVVAPPKAITAPTGATTAPIGTTSGTTPATAVTQTGTSVLNTSSHESQAVVNPSSAGSPATTGGITATVDTATHRASIIDRDAASTTKLPKAYIRKAEVRQPLPRNQVFRPQLTSSPNDIFDTKVSKQQFEDLMKLRNSH